MGIKLDINHGQYFSPCPEVLRTGNSHWWLGFAPSSEGLGQGWGERAKLLSLIDRRAWGKGGVCQGQRELVKIGERGTKNYGRNQSPAWWKWQRRNLGMGSLTFDVISIVVMWAFSPPQGGYAVWGSIFLWISRKSDWASRLCPWGR